MNRDFALKVVNYVLRGKITLEQVREKYCGGNYIKYLEWYHTYYEKVAKLKQRADELNRKLSLANASYTRIKNIQQCFAELEKDIADVTRVFKNADKNMALVDYSSNVREKLRNKDYFSRINIKAAFGTPETEGPLFDYKNTMAELKVQIDVAAINKHEQFLKQQQMALQNDADLYQLFVLIGIF